MEPAGSKLIIGISYAFLYKAIEQRISTKHIDELFSDSISKKIIRQIFIDAKSEEREFFILGKGLVSVEQVLRVLTDASGIESALDQLKQQANANKIDYCHYEDFINFKSPKSLFKIILHECDEETLVKLNCGEKVASFTWKKLEENYENIFLDGLNERKFISEDHFSYETAFAKYYQPIKDLFICDPYLLEVEDLNKSMDNNLLKLIDTLYLRSDCKYNARPTIVIISNVPLKPYDKRPVTADNIEVCESNVPLKPYDKRPDKRRREINKERIEEFKNILASYSCTRKVRIEIILIKEREVKGAKDFDIELLGLKTYLKKEYHDRWIISNYNLLTSGWGFTLNIEKAESEPLVKNTILTFSTVFMKDTLMVVNGKFEFVCKMEEFAKNEKTNKYFILERFKGK